MKASKRNKDKNRAAIRLSNRSGNGRRQLLPALMAVGGACSMMAAPASALELGELKINSSLGQPLRASIAYALNRHEELYNFCVYLRPGLAANGLPVLSKASVSIGDGMIVLTGSRSIREPLLTMQVSIDCPYTAHLSREYTLMIDPPTPVVREGPIIVEPPEATESLEATASAIESATATAATPESPAVTTPATESRPAAAAPAQTRRPRSLSDSRADLDLSPIAESSRYLVQRGDSLSDIASRISDRSIALWPAVDRIFAANPDAFMDGDMNRLKAGSWLHIPDLSLAAAEPMVVETVSPVAGAPASKAADFTAYTGYEAPATEEKLPVIEDEAQEPDVTLAIETEEPVVSESGANESDLDMIQSNDVLLTGNDMNVSTYDSVVDTTASIDIPDTEIVEPVVQPVPVVSTGQDSETAGKTRASWSWLAWLGGTGLALILGLLLFAQRFRNRFGSVAVGASSRTVPNRRETDAGAQPEEVKEDVAYEDLEASPQSASLMLDADFGDGTGLRDAADIDVAQDFGFSASTSLEEELDMEIPEGAEAEVPPDATEMIPPLLHRPSILDSEVLPAEEDDYDMSVIVDVTKQDVVESGATEKDLQAIQVEAEKELTQADLTLAKDTDYQILEQDYEDEFSATQILNAEIEKAAAELADRMDIDDASEIIATLPENTHAVNDDVNDGSASVEVTARLASADRDATDEMLVDDNDVTADMEIESATVVSKKKKAS